MASVVNGASFTFEVAMAQRLFQSRRPSARGPHLFTNYAPAADGRRFLINAVAADMTSRRIRSPWS